LDVDAELDSLRDFMENRFNEYWDPGTGRFRQDGINKVLMEMRQPPDPQCTRRPLACLWTPIHNERNENLPFFRVNGVQGFENFASVWIFSVSGYLRMLIRNGHPEVIDINLPKTKTTLEYLRTIFP
jgi:hypothetical protein